MSPPTGQERSTPRSGAERRSLTVVSPLFFPEQFGTPLYATDLVRWFVDRGWSVRVVTAQPFYPEFRRHPGYGRATRRDHVAGADVYRIPTIVPAGGRASRRAVSDANFLTQGVLARLLRRVPPSAHTVSISPGNPFAVAVGRAVTAPGGLHLCIVHDIQSGLAEGLGMVRSGRVVSAMRATERTMLHRADELLTLSPEMRTSLQALGVRVPIRVMPLWATVAAPATGGVAGPHRADVQFSGNLGRKQGVDDLVAVIDETRRRRPGTTVIVRGAGPAESELRARYATVDGVTVERPVPLDDLPAALSATPLHLVPQVAGAANHVMPSKLVNALAVGGAVVAMAPRESALGRIAASCDAVIRRDVGDVAGTAEAVAATLDAGRLPALADAARRHVAEHHDRETLLAELESRLLAR